MPTASVEHLGAHVVEQHRVDRFFERSAQLIESVDLHFDFHHVTGARAHRGHRGPNRSGQREVVVFDQHCVVQAEAMVRPSAAAHGVFLEHAQTGRRFTRVGHARVRSGDQGDEFARRGGDARKAAEKVQRRAFGGEDGACVPADLGNRLAGADGAPVFDQRGRFGRIVEQCKRQGGRADSGDDARFARDDAGPRDAPLRNDGVGR